MSSFRFSFSRKMSKVGEPAEPSPCAFRRISISLHTYGLSHACTKRSFAKS